MTNFPKLERILHIRLKIESLIIGNHVNQDFMQS